MVGGNTQWRLAACECSVMLVPYTSEARLPTPLAPCLHIPSCTKINATFAKQEGLACLSACCNIVTTAMLPAFCCAVVGGCGGCGCPSRPTSTRSGSSRGRQGSSSRCCRRRQRHGSSLPWGIPPVSGRQHCTLVVVCKPLLHSLPGTCLLPAGSLSKSLGGVV